MSKSWPLVALGEVLKKSEESVSIATNTLYREVTIKLWGKGVVLRREASGTEMAALRRAVVRQGQFILSRIDARNGAFGLVPESLDGAVVSNDFPSFNLNQERLEPKFLEWLSKTSVFVDLCKAASEGTTNRVRLKEEKFLAMAIHLPPLAEQRRIVVRIEELSTKIGEARGLRRLAVEEAKALFESCMSTTFNSANVRFNMKTFQEFCNVVRGGSPRPAGSPIYYDGTIPFLKVADLTKDDKKYLTTYTATIKEAGLSRSRYVPSGTLMLTNSGATLGVPKICSFETCFNDGVQAFLNIPPEISKEYLYYFFKSKTSWFRDWAARGQGQPNLNTEMVKTMSVPLPSIPVQRHIVVYLDNLQAKVDSLKHLQTETAAELNAMLPSILDKAFQGAL